MEKKPEQIGTKYKYRAYFFNNMYLQGIHAGVQSQHCTAELFTKYNPFNTIFFDESHALNQEILHDWASKDKTTIVLNGGMQGQLEELIALFSNKENVFPWAYFKESDFALNGALTNVGIILPERIYNYDKFVESNKIDPAVQVPKLTDYELQIVQSLRGKQLAK